MTAHMTVVSKPAQAAALAQQTDVDFPAPSHHHWDGIADGAQRARCITGRRLQATVGRHVARLAPVTGQGAELRPHVVPTPQDLTTGTLEPCGAPATHPTCVQPPADPTTCYRRATMSLQMEAASPHAAVRSSACRLRQGTRHWRLRLGRLQARLWKRTVLCRRAFICLSSSYPPYRSPSLCELCALPLGAPCRSRMLVPSFLLAVFAPAPLETAAPHLSPQTRACGTLSQSLSTPLAVGWSASACAWKAATPGHRCVTSIVTPASSSRRAAGSFPPLVHLFKRSFRRQAPVSLEYRAVGRGWRALEHYDRASYLLPGHTNPNGASLGLWSVPPTDVRSSAQSARDPCHDICWVSRPPLCCCPSVNTPLSRRSTPAAHQITPGQTAELIAFPLPFSPLGTLPYPSRRSGSSLR